MAMHYRRHPPTNPFTGRGLPAASPYRQAEQDANAKSHSSSISIMAKKAALIVLSFVMFYTLFLGGDTSTPEVSSQYSGGYKERADASGSGNGPVKLSVPEVKSEVSYENESDPDEKELSSETEPTEFRGGKLDEYSYKSDGGSGSGSGDDHQPTTTMATVDAESNNMGDEYGKENSQDLSEKRSSNDVGNYDYNNADRGVEKGDTSSVEFGKDLDEKTQLVNSGHDEDNKGSLDSDKLTEYSAKHSEDESESKTSFLGDEESASKKYDKDVGESHEKLSEYAQQHSDEDESSLTSKTYDSTSKRDADEDGYHKELNESPKKYDDEETNSYRSKSKYDSDTHGEEKLNEYARGSEDALNSEKEYNPQSKYHKDIDAVETSSEPSEYTKTHDKNSEDMLGSSKYRSSIAESGEDHSESKYENGNADKLSEYAKSDNENGEEAVSPGKQHEPESQYGTSVDEVDTLQKDQSESKYDRHADEGDSSHKSKSNYDEEPRSYRKDEPSSEALLEMPIGDTEKATDEKTGDSTTHKNVSGKSASESGQESYPEKLHSKSEIIRGDNEEPEPELVRDSYEKSTGNSEDGLKLENLSTKYRDSIGGNATNDSGTTDVKSYNRDESDKKTSEYSIDERESTKKSLEADVKNYNRDESDQKTSDYPSDESEYTKKSPKAYETDKNTIESETIEKANQETESASVESFERESKYDTSNDSKRSSMHEDSDKSLEGGTGKLSSETEHADENKLSGGEEGEESIKPLDLSSVIESDSQSEKVPKESAAEGADDKSSLLVEKSDNETDNEKASYEKTEDVQTTANDKPIVVSKKGNASQIFDKIKSEVESGSSKTEDTEPIKSNSTTINDKGSNENEITEKDESDAKSSGRTSGETDLNSKVVAGSIRGAASNDEVKSTFVEDDGEETSIGSGRLRGSKLTVASDTIETKESSNSTSSQPEILGDEVEKTPDTAVESDGLSSVEKEVHEDSSKSLSDKNGLDENILDKTEAALIENDQHSEAKNSSAYVESDAANEPNEKKSEMETASDVSKVSTSLPENEDQNKETNSEKVHEKTEDSAAPDELKKVETDRDQLNHEAVSDADERVESEGQAASEKVHLERVESKEELD